MGVRGSALEKMVREAISEKKRKLGYYQDFCRMDGIVSAHRAAFVGGFAVGQRGVQLFFVLSGYLAFASLEKNSSAISYYKKRLVRIVPIYWMCLILTYIEDIVIGTYSSSLSNVLAGQCGPGYLRYFVFLQCFLPSDNWSLWNNHGALWTMSSFVGFYILAPYLYRIMNKFYTGVILLAVFLFGRPYLASWIINIFAGYPKEANIEWFAYMNPLAELYCFLLGAVLFVAIKERKQSIYLTIITMVLIVTDLSWHQFDLLFVLFVAIAVFSDPIVKNEKICKWISWISGGSFALYLIHPMVLEAAPIVWRRIGIDNQWLYAIYLYVLCIGATYILYYGFIIKIEKWVSGKFLD